MTNPHPSCKYPQCDCITLGPTCLVADMESFYREREEREALEPYCSFCGMAKSAVERGEDCGSHEVCSNGGAVMVEQVNS